MCTLQWFLYHARILEMQVFLTGYPARQCFFKKAAKQQLWRHSNPKCLVKVHHEIHQSMKMLMIELACDELTAANEVAKLLL